jgi:O-antigen ligase
MTIEKPTDVKSAIDPILGPATEIEPIFTEPPSLRISGVKDAREAPAGRKAGTVPRVDATIAATDQPEIVKRLHGAARAVLTIALFAVPLVFDPRTVDAFNLVKLTTLLVLTAFASALWAAGALLDPGADLAMRLPRSWISRLSLLMLVVTAVSTALGSSRLVSFYGLYHRFEGLLSLGLYTSVLLLIVTLYSRRPDRLAELPASIGASAVGVSLYVLLQNFGVDVAHWRQIGGSHPALPVGSLGNPGLTGAFLGVAVPLLAYLAWAATRPLRRGAWVAGALLVVTAIWLTQSRAGVLAALAGVLAVGLFTHVRTTPLRKATIVGGVLLVLALVTLAVPGALGPHAPARLDRSAAGVHEVPEWSAAWRMAADRPLLGWGPDTFYGNYTRFRTQADARERGLAVPDVPQNIFLARAVGTGFVGLLAFLVLAGAALVLAAVSVDKLSGRRRALAACFGGALVAYLVQGLYSMDGPALALAGWVCLGALAAIATAPERDESSELDTFELPPAPARRTSWAAYAGVGVLLVLVLALGVRPLRADHAAWVAEGRSAAGWSAETMRLYEKAASLSPWEGAYKGLEAFYLERVALSQAAPFTEQEALVRAARLYERASALQPGNVFFMINAARVFERLGMTEDPSYFARADRWLGRAVTLDAFDPQMHSLYASLLERWASKGSTSAVRAAIGRRAKAQASIARYLRTAAD